MSILETLMMENCGGQIALAADSNNNTNVEKCEKYSLRPRTITKQREDEEFEAWKPRSKTKKRPKQKPAPLSKYRRKTANARERSRMREINEGFEALRRALPHLTPEADNNEKLTKISTLRLAMKYITALNHILTDTTDTESDGESFFSEYASTVADTMSDQSLTPPTFSDHSFSTDFSDQLLSPSDFTGQISPHSDLDICTSGALPLSGDFTISDFVCASDTGCSNSLDSCLPEINFDESEYTFESLNYIANLS
ncbi:helix-loop-helix protein delilah-like [Planococcus citri]|uniref:helix-loop-helix protein delilah-like n=1 Tax=Planococcus citri TaxID=170843 RepID=UPI0031F7741A